MVGGDGGCADDSSMALADILRPTTSPGTTAPAMVAHRCRFWRGANTGVLAGFCRTFRLARDTVIVLVDQWSNVELPSPRAGDGGSESTTMVGLVAGLATVSVLDRCSSWPSQHYPITSESVALVVRSDVGDGWLRAWLAERAANLEAPTSRE